MAPRAGAYAAAALFLVYLAARDSFAPAAASPSASSPADAATPTPTSVAPAAPTGGVTFSILDARGEVERVVAPPRARRLHVAYCSS